MNQRASTHLLNRTALADEFDTDVDKGLSSTEANRRLSENRKKYLSKEKKRLWLRSAEQECLEPLFLFLGFLTVILYETQAAEAGLALLCLAAAALLKGRQAFYNYKLLKNRRKQLPEIQVLRDGKYRPLDEREVVVGDVLWMKKGAEAPVAVKSLSTGITYERGEPYSEESGKAISSALPSVTLKKRRVKVQSFLEGRKSVPLRAQGNEAARHAWQIYEPLVSRVQEKMLLMLCIFCVVLLAVGIWQGKVWFFHGMFFLAAVVCGGLSVWKELLWLWYIRK